LKNNRHIVSRLLTLMLNIDIFDLASYDAAGSEFFHQR
jgi:hypothetical protein